MDLNWINNGPKYGNMDLNWTNNGPKYTKND